MNEFEPKKPETVVGTVMKNGGGALVGGGLGWLGAMAIGVVLAPFTGGVSVPVAIALAAGATVAGGVVGHKASQKVE